MSNLGSRIGKVERQTAKPERGRWWWLVSDPVREDGQWREMNQSEPFDETRIGPNDHVIRFLVQPSGTDKTAGDSK